MLCIWNFIAPHCIFERRLLSTLLNVLQTQKSSQLRSVFLFSLLLAELYIFHILNILLQLVKIQIDINNIDLLRLHIFILYWQTILQSWSLLGWHWLTALEYFASAAIMTSWNLLCSLFNCWGCFSRKVILIQHYLNSFNWLKLIQRIVCFSSSYWIVFCYFFLLESRLKIHGCCLIEIFIFLLRLYHIVNLILKLVIIRLMIILVLFIFLYVWLWWNSH